MINGIFSTLSAKSVNERRLEILSNNVANANTAGFKAHRPIISVASSGDFDEPGELQQTFVISTESYVRFSDAPLVETGNDFDLAIEGGGFFAVTTPQGTMYTRNGQFTLSPEKKLVTMDGNPVQSQGGGDITIDGKDVKIESDGSIFVDGSRTDGLKVVDFENKKSLFNAGKSLFVNMDTTAGETVPAMISVKQGAYEASNVEIVHEMVELINTMRAYETYTKVDQMATDTLDKLIEMGKY
jgi:flagellar basal-body rod protein FlgF